MKVRFEPGDEVVFIGTPLFRGNESMGAFDLDTTHHIVDHTGFEDQFNNHVRLGFTCVLVRGTNGSPQWVDQDCLELAGPTDDEIEALFGLRPKVTDREMLERLAQHKRIPTDVRKEIRGHLDL